MARINKLSAREVKTLPPGKYNDGAGLWLVVRPSGSRAWMFRYTRAGRRHEMGLGAAELVSLAEARKLAREARAHLREGDDPINVRRSKRTDDVPTFRESAAAYIETHRAGWSNAKHAAQWASTLETYAHPVIGDKLVNEIETEDVLEVLKPIWQSKPETATRVRGRIEKVLNAAAVRKYRPRENPAAWRNNLDGLLPPRSKVRAVRHHRALPWADVPAFMERLRARNGIAARALEFAILTAARSGEVRGATWAEIDLEARTWIVPAERMKSAREHRVPLSDAAVDVLERTPRLEGSESTFESIFPSTRTGRPLSDAALGKVLKDMDVDATAHGFRSSFRDWCAESTAYPREVAEQALAHAIADAVEAAYRRGDLFEKRRRLMAEWGAYCTTAPAERADVVPIGGAR